MHEIAPVTSWNTNNFFIHWVLQSMVIHGCSFLLSLLLSLAL